MKINRRLVGAGTAIALGVTSTLGLGTIIGWEANNAFEVSQNTTRDLLISSGRVTGPLCNGVDDSISKYIELRVAENRQSYNVDGQLRLDTYRYDPNREYVVFVLPNLGKESELVPTQTSDIKLGEVTYSLTQNQYEYKESGDATTTVYIERDGCPTDQPELNQNNLFEGISSLGSRR